MSNDLNQTAESRPTEQELTDWKARHDRELVAELKTRWGLIERWEAPAAIADYRFSVATELNAGDRVRVGVYVPGSISETTVDDPCEVFRLDFVGPAGTIERLFAGIDQLVADMTRPADA